MTKSWTHYETPPNLRRLMWIWSLDCDLGGFKAGYGEFWALEGRIWERERGSGLGLEVAKMSFLHKLEYLYVNSHCSEGSFAAASGAHEAAQFKFLLQWVSISLQWVASGIWVVFKFSLQRVSISLQQVAFGCLAIMHFSLQRVASGSPSFSKFQIIYFYSFFSLFLFYFIGKPRCSESSSHYSEKLLPFVSLV